MPKVGALSIFFIVNTLGQNLAKLTILPYSEHVQYEDVRGLTDKTLR